MPANNLTRKQAAERARLISGVNYRISLDLDSGPETFACRTEVRFGCSAPGSATFIEYLAPSVELIELNGRELSLDAFDGNRIQLGDLAAANTLVVAGRSEYSHTGVGMHRFVDPVDSAVYTYTDSEPYDIHRVFPCFDQPDLKARVTLAVRAPAGWAVSANGAATEVPDPATGGWWHFAETQPLSTYITAVVAGEYHVVTDHHDGIDLAIYCRRSLAQYLDPEEIFEITKAGLDFYQDIFAFRYPFGKYDQAWVPEFNAGAMENAGIVTFSERHIFRSRVTEGSREARGDTILHEMAHMWFGDLVTMRWWDDLWLNESFATFMANYALVRATRFTGAWTTFSAGWKTWAYRQDQLPSTHPIVADMPDIDSVKVNFDGITYAKGASVLRQLVAWVGEDAFFAGLREYFSRHAYANTTLADFLAPLEESSGRDLQAWSKEWLETAGVNTLRPGLEFDASGSLNGVAILQEAAAGFPTLRSHRLAVGLYGLQGEALVRHRRVELDVLGARTEVPQLAGEARPTLLVLNDDDLTYAKIRLDPSSFATLIARLRNLSDPLTRALCWAGTWDMTRDAELPTAQYLAAVLANAGSETQITVVENILGQAATAVHFYSNPVTRAGLLRTFAGAVWDFLEAAEPASDHQLAWTRTFLGLARSPEHIALARGLLDGSVTLGGLVVDTELRWLIVRCLAAAGCDGAAELISAELAADPTDAGARHAAGARAALPTAEAKEWAWGQILDASLPFATMRATVGGFQQPDQAELLAPFASRYFGQLGEVFESRSMEVALAFTSGMYPSMLVATSTVAMTDSHLASADPPAPVRRLLLEGRDGIQRALRAQSCDIAAG